MDIKFLLTYINPLVMGICLCVGFAFKTAFAKFPNKYIPLAMLILGLVLACLAAEDFTMPVVLSGMISGLASTGCYELLKNMLYSKKGE